MKKVLAFAAIGETAIGLGLLIVPSVVSRLLLGTELAGVAIPIARVTGLALLGLGIACWPRGTPLCGMLTYSTLTTGYLAWIGFGGRWVGSFLWPATVIHAVLTLLLALAWKREQRRSAA